MNNTKGTIFDIQRFSVNDGPGIRTSVFMKGCALECSWCHNPESWKSEPELAFIEEKCIMCEECANVCPNNVHSFIDNAHKIDRDKCKLCGKCVEVCSTGALKIYGKEYTVKEIFDIVIKDKLYYEESGGGVTVSGGEPLQQYKFVLELFQMLKLNDVHTCLDTTGFCNTSILEHIIPHTDLFLFDYKLSNYSDYCTHTNINYDAVLRNLNILDINKKEIILRCPIIPNLNDNDAHIDSLINLVSGHINIIQVDIIPYHKLGESKYNYFGSANRREVINKIDMNKIEYMTKKLQKILRVPVLLSKEYSH